MNEIAAWGELSAALIVFFLSHMIPARPQIRRYLIGRLGRGSYILLYALISVGLLAWVIAAAGRAPFVPVWDFEPWQIWVPNIAMPFACVLIALGIGAPNPF